MIRSVEVVPYALPFRQPYVTAKGRLDRREMVLLRISSEDGLTGLGEAVPLSLRGGTVLESVVNELETWGEASIASRPEKSPPGFSAPARCAIETALADLGAREREVALHEYLMPGTSPRAVFCNATLTTGSAAAVLAQAEKWGDDGFTVFKLKVGSGEDFEQVSALREGLGDGVKIRLDANGSWSLEQAAEILGRLEPLGIELAEQPVAALGPMAELRERTGIPLVADESVAGPEQAEEAARLNSCAAVTVKLSKTGSLDAGLGGFLPTYLSSALDGPVGIAAAAHVAQTLPDDGAWSGVAHGLATSRLFSVDIASVGCRLDGPDLHLPDGSGLGVEIDEDSLQAHRL